MENANEVSPTTTRKRYNEIREHTRYGGRGELRINGALKNWRFFGDIKGE